MREVNEAVIATYLAGGNQRRIRGALQPLLKAAPLSKSAVSRIVATLKDGLTAWTARPLADVDLVDLYLDAVCVRVRSAGKVASVPVLTAGAVLADGRKDGDRWNAGGSPLDFPHQAGRHLATLLRVLPRTPVRPTPALSGRRSRSAEAVR